MSRTCARIGLSLWLAVAWASTAPAETTASAPAQNLELETLKAQLSDQARQAQTRREAAVLLLTRPYPQAVALAGDFLDDASNRPAQIAIAEAVAETRRTDPAFVKPLLAMLTGGEPSVRAPAAAALAAYRAPAVLEEFARIASDRKTAIEVRLAVVEAMGGAVDKKVAGALVGLLDDPNATVVKAACGALARMTGMRAFQRDPAQWRKWWSRNSDKLRADWLGEMAENLARSNAALEKENLSARRRLAQAMSDLYNATPPAGRDAMLEDMLKDPVADVRLAGAQLASQRLSISQPLPETLRAQIRARLVDPDASVRAAAALLVVNLGGAGDDAPGKLLAKRLTVEQAVEVREALYQALGLLRDPADWNLLMAGIGNSDPRESAAAAAALARLTEKIDPVDKRRAQAASALKKRYQTCTAPETAPLREALLGAMAATGDKNLSKLMLLALKDEAATVRLGAIKALGQLGLPETAPAIEAMTGDPDRGVRLAAISAVGVLGGLGELRAVLARTDATIESDPAVRQQAWTVATDLLAKADTARLAALVDEFSRRQDAGEFLIRLLRLWSQRVADGKPEQWAPVRIRLGETLMAASRPADAAVELGTVHAALLQTRSREAGAVWLKWIDALLSSDDPAGVARIADSTDPSQQAAGVTLLLGRLEALKDKKEWDSLLRLSAAALEKLGDRLSDRQRRVLTALMREAQTQQQVDDRRRVGALVSRLAGPDDLARAAAKELATMKLRAARPLLEELRAVVSAAKVDAQAEKAILESLGVVAPQLTGYDPAAPVTDRLKTLDAWAARLAAPATVPASPRQSPATGPAR